MKLNAKKKSPIKTVLALLLALVTIGIAAYNIFIAGDGRYNPFAPPPPTTTSVGNALSVHQTEQEHRAIDHNTGTQFVNNELLLTANRGTARADVEAFVSVRGGEIVGYDEYLGKYQIQLDSNYSLESLEDIRAEYEQFEVFTKSRINLIYPAEMCYTPNDSEWKSEWGSSPGGSNWGAEAIRAPDMWGSYNVLTRNAVNVGVLDNQFYTEHEDLIFVDTFLNWFDPKDMRHGGEPRHGTHVAGTIAATFNNGKGIAGIAPRVNLYAASMFGLADRSVKINDAGLTVNEIEAGLTYLICIRECKVVNFSYTWGNMQAAADVTDALRIYIEEYGLDFVITKAAGNNKIDAACDAISWISDPLIKDRIIIVGAAKLKNNGEIKVANYSNYGSRVDLIAPGGSNSADDNNDGPQIYSTVYKNRFANANLFDWSNSGYANMPGTSMAAPHAAGVAAVMWSVNPNLTGAQIKRMMCDTASGSYGYDSSAGRGDTYRLLNGYEAVKAAAEYGLPEQPPAQPQEPIPPPAASGISNGTYISDDGLLSQTWVFSGENEVFLSFAFIQSTGTYRLDGTKLYITSELWGTVTTSVYNISNITTTSFYIDDTKFIKQ